MVEWNDLLAVFLGLFLLRTAARLFLATINIRHLRRHGHEVPEVFRDQVDKGTLTRMNEYSVEHLRFGSFARLFDNFVILVMLLSGVLPWLCRALLSLRLPFVAMGLLFFGILTLSGVLLEIPFDLYGTFGIERRHGFSTITGRLWITDQIKSFLLLLLLGGILLSALLALMQSAAGTWWLWVWLVFASFQLLLLWLYPVAIAPLFNRYTPVGDEALRLAIVDMMTRAGLKTEGVYQVNETARSRHSNAYFTGVGTTKRIVLYDTLLQSHSAEEILAILAHEIGHWKRKHVLVQLLFVEAASLIVLYAASLLLHWPLLYRTFGFAAGTPPYVGLLLLAAVAGPFSFFLMPAGAMVMRSFEREADDYGRALMRNSLPLANALRRLAKDNLANLHPHPLYAWFYYSHPPLGERIARLEAGAAGEERP